MHKRQEPAPGIDQVCWGDCNGSGHADYWHSIDEDAESTDDFHETAAVPILPSNHGDHGEPSGHPNLGSDSHGASSPIAQFHGRRH